MARPRKLSTDILQAALIGFQHMRDQLEQRITDLRRQVGMQIAGRLSPEDIAPKEPAPAKRRMSASARRRISLAQKKRWAAQKATSATAAAPKARKRVISAAGKARIAAAAKKRWAAFRKAQRAAKK